MTAVAYISSRESFQDFMLSIESLWPAKPIAQKFICIDHLSAINRVMGLELKMVEVAPKPQDRPDYWERIAYRLSAMVR